MRHEFLCFLFKLTLLPSSRAPCSFVPVIVGSSGSTIAWPDVEINKTDLCLDSQRCSFIVLLRPCEPRCSSLRPLCTWPLAGRGICSGIFHWQLSRLMPTLLRSFAGVGTAAESIVIDCMLPLHVVSFCITYSLYSQRRRQKQSKLGVVRQEDHPRN